jgi:hypothetical protein
MEESVKQLSARFEEKRLCVKEKESTYIQSQWISTIYISGIITKEIINKHWRVSQTLDRAVHKASISKILQSY